MLSPYRVLDLTGELGFLTGKLLGDLGADVIKVEPPGGDPARLTGPFYQGVPHPERSLYWFGYNNNKRGITLNLQAPQGRELFLRLAATADFVLESAPPGRMRELGLSFADLGRQNPGLILVSITPFGQHGPYCNFLASDLEIMALSGAMSLAGEPDGPPLRVSVPQAPMWVGAEAALGALTALFARHSIGRGQHVDIAAQEAVLSALAHAPAFWDLNRQNPTRSGIYMTGRSITGARMRVFWPCRDGWVNFIIYGGSAGQRTGAGLVAWMDERGGAPPVLRNCDWTSLDVTTITQAEIDRLEEPIGAFFSALTKAEFLAGVTRHGMLGYPVATPADILADPQLQQRGFWTDVDHPELGVQIRYPGVFARFGAGAFGIRRQAPLPGEHNRAIFVDELGLTAAELTALAADGVI